MPFRKDHLQLVTDAGATLDIGWAYGTPYSLDPINGVDVDVQTAQGVNQVGVSVERQSVAGMSRELIIHCHSSHGDADAELLLEKLPYFTSGTMYLVDKFFCTVLIMNNSLLDISFQPVGVGISTNRKQCIIYL